MMNPGAADAPTSHLHSFPGNTSGPGKIAHAVKSASYSIWIPNPHSNIAPTPQ